METLASELKASIEQWAECLRRDSALSHRARAGQLPPRALAVYLESLRYLFRSSYESLGLAAAASHCRGDAELARYFETKAFEEQGHDMWAVSDLAHLPPLAAEGIRPAAAIVRLVDLQRRLIEHHPMCFVAYAVWAEYFTALLGDEWLEVLAAQGYSRGQLSSIAKHLEADRAHAAAGFAEVEHLWRGSPDREDLLSAVARAGAEFARFCDEICSEADQAA